MSAQPRKIRTFAKWLLISLATLAVVLALLIGAFGFIVGRVPEYRVQLQAWISERSGLVVEFRTLSARLRLYGPELVFDDAVVRTPDRTHVLATAKRGSVGFDLWNSLANGRLTAGRFALESPAIGLIRTREGRIQLLGQSALPERDTPFALEQLPTGRFHVEDAVVTFRDELTGRGPWSLSGVNFELARSSGSMRVRGDASLPRTLGRELQFSATAEGAIEQSATLVATFSVRGNDLDLAGWADVLPDEWPAPETGRGSMSISGTMHGAALKQFSVDVDFAQLTAALPAWTMPLPGAEPLPRRTVDDDAQDRDARADDAVTQEQAAAPQAGEPDLAAMMEPPQMLSYERLEFEVNARKQDDQWSLTVSDLQAARAGSVWRTKEIAARWSRDEQGGLKASGKADRIVLDNLWPLLAYLPESEALAKLRALRVSGALNDVSMSYARTAPDAAPTYSLQADLTDIAFRPVGRAPGLTGLGGRLLLTDQSGKWQLAGRNVRFELPRMFRDVIEAQSVDGTVDWQRGPNGLVLNSDELRLRGDDGRAVARFAITLPADGSSPVLDLFAQGEDLKVSSTRKYIPADKLGVKTLEWFDRAFVDGRVANAQFQYKGPSRSFPFRNDEGSFLARGHVENAVFDYQPGWQPARELVADVEFRNEGMSIHTTAGIVGSVRLSQATARIADFREGNLLIQATAGGDVGAGLQFLRESPLGPKLGEQFARVGGSGPMSADVRLHLPLKRLQDRNVEVTARMANASVSMQRLAAPVRALTGELTVKNALIAAADLQGQWLGGPLHVRIQPEDAGEARNPSASLLEASGQAIATELHEVLGLPATVSLNGATDWQMTTRLLSGAAGGDSRRTVRIESDLRGLGIVLPEPLGKNSGEERPLQVALEFDGAQSLLARATLGDVRALIRMRQRAGSWSLDRGSVRADAVAPSLPAHAGVRIEGTVQRFVLDDWLALRGSGSGGSGGKPLSAYLQAANVRIGQFELFGYRWPEVRGMLQATQTGWRVDVSGEKAVGQVLIPENFNGTQPLRATMERLALDKAQSPDAAQPESQKKTSLDPRSLPGLQVYVGDFRIGPRRIGAVNLKATRVPQGIRFDSATVQGESVRGEANGEWLATVDGQRSSLNASVESQDVAATLRALNYTEFVQAKRGAIRANLSWPGGFDDNILEHASGGISLNAESGQLVNLQPGAGRVLGLFSVAALPRRLALDFSDLTDKGLAFDTVHGDFELRDGNAYTSNLLLRGPAAEIGIAGRTGLGTRDYDQTAVVTGNLGASLPVAGALAGGPAVGAALLLFSQVFKEPLKGITRGYYRITGPWDDPVVERVDASEVKAQLREEH